MVKAINVDVGIADSDKKKKIPGIDATLTEKNE